MLTSSSLLNLTGATVCGFNADSIIVPLLYWHYESLTLFETRLYQDIQEHLFIYPWSAALIMQWTWKDILHFR